MRGLFFILFFLQSWDFGPQILWSTSKVDSVDGKYIPLESAANKVFEFEDFNARHETDFGQDVTNLQFGNTKTYYDYLSDFIFPSIFTVVTILFSVWLSRREFNKTKRHEELKQRTEDDALKKLIARNLRIVRDQILSDIKKFKHEFIEQYNIEKGFLPQSMLLTFPELLSLSSIDTFRYEQLYLTNENDEEKINQLYLTLGCIEASLKSYDKLDEEINKINAFISENEITLLKTYNLYTEEILRGIEFYLKETEEIGSEISNELKEIIALINRYESDINNFYEFRRNIDDLESLDTFTLIRISNSNSIATYKNEYSILYRKIEQEISLFHNRVEYLTNRLGRSTVQFDKFLKL